jgi:hypothetical protein
MGDRMTRRLTISLLTAVLGAGLMLTGGGVAAASPTWTFTPVVSHLNGPRGVAFDQQGNLYVAEAGQFQSVEPTPPAFVVNQTGKVDKFSLHQGTATLQWATSFNSLSDTFIAPGGEVLGPAGLAPDGNRMLMLMSQNQTGVHKVSPGLAIPQIGHLFSLNRNNGHTVDVTNIGDQEYAWAAENASLWEEFPDSNPNAVLVIKARPGNGQTRTFVVDAGANTVAEVMPNGRIRVIAFIPNDILRDSTPTCITQGPDGALYVGTLDLVDNLTFGPGHSHVYRIDPNTHENFLKAAHLWASGLTTVYGCAFDRQGNFWATEMFQPNPVDPAGPPGDVVEIPFANPSSITHIGGGGSLPLPGGIAVGPDSAMYVAVGAPDVTPDSGGVVRVSAG